MQFEETQFSNALDYCEPPVDPYDHSWQRRHQLPSLLPEPELNWPIYDEIVVLAPPALEIFMTYGPDYEQDNEPQSFADAMRRPDHGLWWEAFCNKIRAIVANNNSWTFTDLPLTLKPFLSNGSVIQ